MNRSLLIVDDDLPQLEMWTRCLIKDGCRVVGVAHPRDALRAASFRTFRVALLDLCLPEMDGVELMRRLQRLQDGIQVILVSAYEYPGARASAEGAFYCFRKPFSLWRLKFKLDIAFERSSQEGALFEPTPDSSPRR